MRFFLFGSSLTGLFILFIPLLLILLWAVLTYNRLVRTRNLVEESWSGIDTELRRRYDLIPNLVATVKGYAAHEREVLERVIQARQAAAGNHGSPASQARDENTLVSAMGRLFAIAEAYPRLKADGNFLALQDELTNTEDCIQRSRRFYNANVRDMNTQTQVCPSNIIAGMFGFTKAEFFEIDDPAARRPADVSITR